MGRRLERKPVNVIPGASRWSLRLTRWAFWISVSLIILLVLLCLVNTRIWIRVRLPWGGEIVTVVGAPGANGGLRLASIDRVRNSASRAGERLGPDASVSIANWLPTVLLGVIAFTCYRRLPRPKAKGMCACCGYDLRGNESGRCPECGYVIENQPSHATVDRPSIP